MHHESWLNHVFSRVLMPGDKGILVFKLPSSQEEILLENAVNWLPREPQVING